jgi:hypothetical protein
MPNQGMRNFHDLPQVLSVACVSIVYIRRRTMIFRATGGACPVRRAGRVVIQKKRRCKLHRLRHQQRYVVLRDKPGSRTARPDIFAWAPFYEQNVMQNSGAP